MDTRQPMNTHYFYQLTVSTYSLLKWVEVHGSAPAHFVNLLRTSAKWRFTYGTW